MNQPVIDVENGKLVDRLIFGYLCRRQYHDTLRSFWNESPSLREDGSRFQNGNDVFIQVNDSLYDKNLEQIISAFSIVGRFDVTPDLIDFGIRLRDLTNEFSTMTAVRGRISDNQMKLYGKRSLTRPLQRREPHNVEEADDAQQFHNTRISGTDEIIGGQPFVNQQKFNYKYKSQSLACTVSAVNLNISAQPSVQNSTVTTAQRTKTELKYLKFPTCGTASSNIGVLPSQRTSSSQGICLMENRNSTVIDEEPYRICYDIDVMNSTKTDIDTELSLATTQSAAREVGESEGGAQTNFSASFFYESGDHKRKAAVPHRRDELVAHTAQSLIIPNGALLELNTNRMSNKSHMPLIDDSAVQSLDRLINRNVDERMCNTFSATHSNNGQLAQEETQELFNNLTPSLNIDTSASLPHEVHTSKSCSIEDGEIISDQSLNENFQNSSPSDSTDARPCEFEIRTGRERPERIRKQRSSFDSGSGKRCEGKVELLKEFNRNPPKTNIRCKGSAVKLSGVVIHEAGNVPRLCLSYENQNSRPDGRAPSSRESSPHCERVKIKVEEGGSSEKEMERELQRDKGRIKRQRRDCETRHDKDRCHQPSPPRKPTGTTNLNRNEKEKRESRDNERKREHGEERQVFGDTKKRRVKEKTTNVSAKRKQEEELEVRRHSERQRRADAIRRKEEEYRQKRHEKERYEERKRDEENRRMEVPVENEKCTRKAKEEVRTSRCIADCKKVTDQNGYCSPVKVSQFPKLQQRRYAPYKGMQPATNLESSLGSRTQDSTEICKEEASTSRHSSKKQRIDLLKATDIIDRLHSGRSV